MRGLHSSAPAHGWPEPQDVNGGVINMHISVKGGMAANQVGVESISGVRMVRRANNEGHKGIEHSRFLLFEEVRVELFMKMLD